MTQFRPVLIAMITAILVSGVIGGTYLTASDLNIALGYMLIVLLAMYLSCVYPINSKTELE